MADKDNWKIKGDFVLSCNCTVFCPCVISLGQHEPTEGTCQAWAGAHIEEGFHEDTDLAGINECGNLAKIVTIRLRHHA